MGQCCTARRWKERTYPELSGRFGRARLVVLACEVGGRLLEETNHFLLTRQGQSARSSTTTQDECEAELVEEVEVNSRVCRRQSIRPVSAGTEGRNRS